MYRSETCGKVNVKSDLLACFNMFVSTELMGVAVLIRRYRTPEEPSFKDKFTAVIVESLDQYFPSKEDVEIIAEPGRYYVFSAFTLATNINTKKEDYGKGADGKERRKLSYYLNVGLFGSFLYSNIFREEHKTNSGKGRPPFS
ncbi:antizyme inhibitor 2-like [Mixophyes fleayi]|uniref:antizyme inhibitor 2-like n=1 Tax=Mixophyes fleayi TaxID=3061075 RepID=UPI003F4D90AC